MMTLANYGLKTGRHKDPNSAKSLNKSLQIRNRAELSLKQCLKTFHKIPAEKRSDIISLIEEYYSRVPFDVVIWNKYQTKQCILTSIQTLDSNFNPYLARRAFKAIEEMLLNLIHLPWHKEFTKISTYSGKFRYSISNPLVGVLDIFKAAGFEQGPSDNLLNLVLPEDKMPQHDESEGVTSVIFDCMVAQVVLTDVINIFESCCKSLKQAASELASSDINCYKWIQTYIRERSHNVTDKARSNIQELLNNITNHLTRLRITSAKSSTNKIENYPGVAGSSSPKRDLIDNSDSAKLALNQQQVRRFLTQKSLEDANLLRISDDLLKLPNSCGLGDRGVIQHRQYVTDTDEPTTIGASSHASLNDATQQKTWRDNSFTSHVQHRQQPVARHTMKLAESYDMIDSHTNSNVPREFEKHDSRSQPIRIDAPHNDREPLLQKHERGFNAQKHGNECSQIDRISPLGSSQFYRSQSGPFSNNMNYHSTGLAGRFQHDKPSMYGAQISSQPPQSTIKNASSRYDSSSNRKYESRDTDRTFNSRLHWSCGSCTYNNYIISEICEMCGNRKPS